MESGDRREATRVYFVRHAQPVHAHADERTRPLTDEGRRDTALVVETLAPLSIAAVYSSPYLRSVDTVSPLAQRLGLPVRLDERLRERACGEGGNGQGMFAKRWADRDYHEPGGESIVMVGERNALALDDILRAHPGEAVAVGTHGTALSALISRYVPAFGLGDFLRIIDWMPYIVRMDFDGERFLRLEDLAHIEKPYRP